MLLVLLESASGTAAFAEVYALAVLFVPSEWRRWGEGVAVRVSRLPTKRRGRYPSVSVGQIMKARSVLVLYFSALHCSIDGTRRTTNKAPILGDRNNL